MHVFDRRTDRQRDGWTEFSSLDRACIPCSTVKTAVCVALRDCNPGIPYPEIPDRFSIPKSRDYERPNPGISGLENNVLTKRPLQ